MHALIGTKLSFLGACKLVDRMSIEAIIFELDMMEKEIVYLKGYIRTKAKKAYFNLLKSHGTKLELQKPIYLLRYE